MKVKKVLIDTDCGIDDAVAIMIALASPELEVKGIATVSGNVALDRVVDNVLRLLTFLDRTEIPVFRGASRPLVEQWHRAEGIHGANGLGGIELPAPRLKEQQERAPAGIYRIAKENPGLTLLTLGPLTNIAMALNLYPELVELVGEIVTMGGAIERGNVTRFAEFNFYADPESAQSVIDSGIPLSIVTWDATLTVLHSAEDLMQLGFAASASGRLFLDLQKVPFSYIEKAYGMRGITLPDPLTAAYLVDPSIARRVVTSGLRMELGPGTLRGSSIRWPARGLKIVLDIDKGAFDQILCRLIALKR
jgi:inosine-uridine nucleoside N-ribohydrolase